MKALSIEELKAMELGDWVWIVEKENAYPNNYFHGEYCHITPPYIDGLCYGWQGSGGCYKYSDYGTKWLAYKNKEQAECKGELVELPCNVGDKVYYLNMHPSVSLKTNTIYEGKVVRFHILNSFNSLDMDVFLDIKIHNEYGTTEISNTKDFGVLVFKTKEQAEQKLKELRGEL